MDAEHREKLERYLRNANRFLWGLGRIDQKRTYEWLELNGFTDNGTKFKSSYRDTTEKLINVYGIEEVLRRIIKPRVYEVFGTPLVDLMRRCWMAGVRPTVDMLKANNCLYILEEKRVIRQEVDRDPEPFLLYNRQFNFIDGWGQLAGIWFEEVEPYLKEDGELTGVADEVRR